MAIKKIKSSKSEDEKLEEDTKVKSVVEKTLKEVEANGDKAVRNLSQKFDNFDRSNFLLTESEINAAMQKVSVRDMEDIKFAQSQIRRFAEEQMNSMKNIEIETLPGVILGHKNIPVQSVGCYVPGGKFPMVASAFHFLQKTQSLS